MSLATALFVILAAVTAVSAVGVAVSRSVIHSAVWLLFTLAGVALLYLLLGAEFLAATQLIVYVGGTMILIVFGVMLTSGGPFATLAIPAGQRFLGAVIALTLLTMVILAVLDLPSENSTKPNDIPDVHTLGISLLGVHTPANPRYAYLLPFEIVSVHLLAVLIAAAYLARAKKRHAGVAP
jgi:NADH-quinone oxidoreductase subunit J